ncbi:GNAT family N-acetyltransferase [Dactylosporangium sp. AC04546]|uniref:GNAT family N-acetyltransferase n=1 Tax=Dactylosporangium sp. AC04546 TaxID=2862460 RepID=UPI001EDC9653|nr:GNAT family N-acetyltransferase [Dactylosporangium sp. AC04546]WVK86237.1 GNAT family N-acetyltransferase [Dactylosporangium sp. AC04546]
MSHDVLDIPAWAALAGPHRRFAEVSGRAVRYHPEVALFGAVAPDAGDDAWDDVAKLAGPAEVVTVVGEAPPPPAAWEVVLEIPGVQLVDVALEAAHDPEAVRLTAADVPEMLDLVERTQPGPFRARTIELGTYLGLRHNGRLIAMAGERMHPPGWTEISAVCTDPGYRGRGLATRLVKAVAAGIRERGEQPFLHASASNINAIRLYEALGFRLRRHTTFRAVRTPG